MPIQYPRKVSIAQPSGIKQTKIPKGCAFIMRKPNGYGSVVKLNGNRRKPYAARITTGFEPYLDKHGQVKSRQKYHTIGTYPNQREAELALAVYNNDPYDPIWAGMTFSECYQKALDNKGELAKSTLNGYKTAYNKCAKLYNKKMVNIKIKDLQQIIDNEDSISKQEQLIKTFNMIYDFVVNSIGLFKSNIAKTIKITAEEEEKEEACPYSKEELQSMWNLWNENNKYLVSVSLCQTYTGTRIMEMLTLEKENVHLEERWARVKGTKNNIADRNIPLRKEIIPILKYHLEDKENDSDYIFIHPKTKKPFIRQGQYMNFYDKLRKYIFTQEHTTHDARRTFVSMADDSNINQSTLKKIVGHTLDGVTGKVYTYKSVEELIKEVDKIKFL